VTILSFLTLRLIATANYRAAIAAGWEDRCAGLVVSAHIMLGARKSEGEWVLVPDPDLTALSQSKVTFLKPLLTLAQ